MGVAPGTERINTSKNVDANTREYPPVKVMQTAVVGTKGSLSYRLNLEDFPATARAYAFFAEIEDLGVNQTRKFKMEQPYNQDYSNAVVNIAENANGSYTLYEPSYMNVTLDFVLTFAFAKTRDSTQGPLLNAMEISRYVEIAAKTDEKDGRRRMIPTFICFAQIICSQKFISLLFLPYESEQPRCPALYVC